MPLTDFDDTVVCTYSGCVANKARILKIIKNSNDDCAQVPLKEIIDKYELRNSIVHCCFIDKNEEIVMDLTNVMREFVYHFDRTDECSKLKYFFTSLKHDTTDLSIVVYKNDKDISTKTFPVCDVSEKHFSYILS
jgi:hypothetical protein